MMLKRNFVFGLTILFILTIFLIIYAKLKIKHVDYNYYIQHSLYNFLTSDDEIWGYKKLYNLYDYFIDEKVNTLDDLKNLSDYILIVSNDKEPTFKGNGIINNCTIKKVIKGSDLMVNDEIKIYDLISIWKVFGTYYLGGSTPLKIGNEYIVFLKKTINASVSNTYVFASVKYGHLLTSIENKILENYEQNSLTIDEISNYNFVFSKDSNKTEIEIYKNISKQIIEMIY